MTGIPTESSGSVVTGELTRVIDTHTHVVAADRVAYPLQTTERSEATVWCLDHGVTTEGLLVQLDVAGVSGAVLVQALSGHGYDNRYVADSRRRWPVRTVGVGAIDPFAEDPVADVHEAVGSAGLRGIRVFGLNPRVLGEPHVADIARAVAEFGVPLLVVTAYEHVPYLDNLLSRVPDLILVLDHCGLPDLARGSVPEALPEVLRLADHAGVHLKVTASTLASLPAGRLADFGVSLAARVGADRLMWGSDFPHKFDRSYSDLVAEAKTMAAGMSSADAARFLFGTAIDLWPELSASVSPTGIGYPPAQGGGPGRPGN
jgi:L-fuconolactonase